jgi:hypothetical protein
MKRLTVCLVVPTLLLFLSACDSERLTQFAEFATAGSQYVQAFHTLIAQAGSVFIATDSLVLTTARNQVGAEVVANNAAEFRGNVHKDDELLKTTLNDLGLIDQQATQLGAFFDSISKLTDGKAAASMTTATTGLLTSIEGLNSAVGKVTLGGTPLSTVVSGVTKIAVAHFEVQALNQELQKAAPVIDTALSLQEAAVDRIGDRMKADLTVSLANSESTTILDPYVKNAALPANWNASRETYLRATVTINNLDNAKSAVKMLHTAFIQLCENKQTISLATLLAEINKIAGYVAAAEEAKKGTSK